MLSRPEHIFQEQAIDQALAGKRVLVTGAGGTIGSEIVRRVLKSPAEFVGCVGHSEAPIFNLLQSLPGHGDRLNKAIMDAGSSERISQLLEGWKPDIIFHAAAHKHVGLMESQPAEAFRNNTEATINLATAAIKSSSVRKFVFISTDKAARPTSIMGASKRVAEAALAKYFSPFAVFCRFGNVLGSSGSLVEIAEDKILRKQPIKITDPTMRRYFITAKEAVGLVMSAGLVEEGIAFSLDMGALVSIMHILTKLCPPDMVFEFGAPGSGEKTDEVILNVGEYFQPTSTAAVKRIVLNESADVDAALARIRANPHTLVHEANLL